MSDRHYCLSYGVTRPGARADCDACLALGEALAAEYEHDTLLGRMRQLHAAWWQFVRAVVRCLPHWLRGR